MGTIPPSRKLLAQNGTLMMVFDVTNFDIHDATEREDFLDKVEDFETPKIEV